MSRRLRSFTSRLRPEDVAGRPLFIFDTCGPLDPDPAKNVDDRWLFPGGGETVRADLTARGVVVWPEVLRCLVTGMKGPLAGDALDEARAFARRFADGALS